jgi:SAM-dependent methyltransferase
MRTLFRNMFYTSAGVAFLVLSKLKNLLHGYSTPKPFAMDEVDKCVDYDLGVVDAWLQRLGAYTGSDGRDFLQGKRVLELGPGSDLGVGLYLLAKQAGEYNAVDVNNLIKSAPEEFYQAFFQRLNSMDPDIDEAYLHAQLAKAGQGQRGDLNFFLQPDFDIVKALEGRRFDIIFSQAAFEHFDDPAETIRAMSRVAAPGCVLVSSVDLQTHSRWVREKDPNNIYRYPKWFYDLFYFPGVPNRVRPYQYADYLEQNGWTDIRIEADTLLSQVSPASSDDIYSARFNPEENQMDYLSIWIHATKQ